MPSTNLMDDEEAMTGINIRKPIGKQQSTCRRCAPLILCLLLTFVLGGAIGFYFVDRLTSPFTIDVAIAYDDQKFTIDDIFVAPLSFEKLRTIVADETNLNETFVMEYNDEALGWLPLNSETALEGALAQFPIWSRHEFGGDVKRVLGIRIVDADEVIDADEDEDDDDVTTPDTPDDATDDKADDSGETTTGADEE